MRADIYRWSSRRFEGEQRDRSKSLCMKSELLNGKLIINVRVMILGRFGFYGFYGFSAGWRHGRRRRMTQGK